MRETLQTFIERTAHSRDANGFLDQYHRVEVDRFLLLIPKLSNLEETDDFISEIQYLVKLELFPTIMFCEEFLSIRFKRRIMKALCSKKGGLDHLQCKFVDLVKHLKKLALDRPFFKYMLVEQPLLNAQGEVINLLHLKLKCPELEPKSLEAMVWLKPLLEHLGPAFSMQMVRSDRILEELFTKRGAGSLVSLGYEFNLVKIDEIDQQRLITLLEKGFLRKLKSNYFAKLRSHGGSVLLEKDYRGAIVIQHFGDFHYLDKVVVAPEFFGRGMGSILLDELTEHLERYSLQHPKLIWRAKLENPFLPRYASLVYEFARRYPGRCGTLSDGVYVYHFIGLKSQEREKAYELMRNYPSSFMTVEA